MSLQFLSDKESLPSQSHTAPVVSVCWIPSFPSSQGIILSGDCKGKIKAFDAQSALCYRDLPSSHSNAVHCITANAAGDVALSNAIDGTITLWDLTSFAKSTPQNNDASDAVEVDAGPEEPTSLPLPVEDASKLVLGTIDSLTAHSKPNAKLSEAWKTVLHPTAPLSAAVGAGATVSLHSLPSGESSSFGKTLALAPLPTSLEKRTDLFGLSLAFHPSGELLAVGTNTGSILLYALSSLDSSSPHLTCVSTYSDHASPVRALSFLPTLLLVGCDDRTITIHDVKTILNPSQTSHLAPNSEGRIGATVASLTGHKGWILDIAPTASAGVFASVAADKSIKFWDLGSATKNTPVWNGGEVAGIRAFAFQPPPVVERSEADGVKQEEVTEAGTGVMGSMTRFVTASEDGKLRWYRGAGLG